MLIYVVEELVPICTDIIDNSLDRKLNCYARQGYEIENVDSLEQLKSGDKYLDENGVIKTKE